MRPGHKEAPHIGRDPVGDVGALARKPLSIRVVWSFFLTVAGSWWTRVVVLILLTMFQLVLLWLLGQLVDVSLGVMELWLELARKHLEITL